MELLWWHWAVGGIALIVAELVVPSFVLIWFGLGALVVALAVAGADIGLTAQLALWLIVSIALVAGWFKVFKPGMHKTKIGMADANVVGEIGVLVHDVAPFAKGQVRFQKPILGADVWECIADEAIGNGERVKVLDVEGSFLKVGEGLNMGDMLFFVIALLVFAGVTLAKGIRIVPQGEEWIVERLGKYHGTLHPGLNIIIPYLDNVAYKLVTKDIILDVQEQEVITRDNAVIVTNAIAFIKVTDPIKAVYGVTDFSEAIRNMIMTTLRSIIGEMQLDEALSNRDMIKARLRESIADEAIDWGLTVKSVEIQDIKPSMSMQKAMEMQASAERERKAMITRAEGEKQAMILQAEARLESAQRDAKAQVTLAEASAEAIRRVTTAIGDQEAPMRYLLGEKYVAAMGRLAESANAKTILIPGDLQETLRSVLGRHA